MGVKITLCGKILCSVVCAIFVFLNAQRHKEEALGAVHNVLFVQYDSPVSKIDPCLLQGYIRHGAIIMPVSTTGHGRHGAILWGTRGYIMGEIADLEFEIHKNEKKCIFLPIEQAGTNIC